MKARAGSAYEPFELVRLLGVGNMHRDLARLLIGERRADDAVHRAQTHTSDAPGTAQTRAGPPRRRKRRTKRDATKVGLASLSDGAPAMPSLLTCFKQAPTQTPVAASVPTMNSLSERGYMRTGSLHSALMRLATCIAACASGFCDSVGTSTPALVNTCLLAAPEVAFATPHGTLTP